MQLQMFPVKSVGYHMVLVPPLMQVYRIFFFCPFHCEYSQNREYDPSGLILGLHGPISPCWYARIKNIFIHICTFKCSNVSQQIITSSINGFSSARGTLNIQMNIFLQNKTLKHTFSHSHYFI